MTVDHGVDFGVLGIDAAVNEPLQIGLALVAPAGLPSKLNSMMSPGSTSSGLQERDSE